MLKMATELERPRAYRTAGNMDGYGRFLVEECSPLRRQIVADMDVLLKHLQQDSAATSSAANAEASQARFWITALSVLSGVLCSVVGVVIVRSLVGQLGGEPAHATQVAQAIASGQLTCHVDVSRARPSSMIHAMNAMRHGLAEIVAKVRTGTETIASASSQIASGNNDLSSRTETQASTLSQVTGSMAQLVASVHQNADYARQASALANTASTVSVEGGAAVDEVVATMRLIEESSRKIVDIIAVIDGIAFQTNILALNAAVEAARAGEQGRGFAVVADEVRALAARTQASTSEINEMLTRLTQGVSSSVSAMENTQASCQSAADATARVTSGLDDMAGSVSHINSLSAQIATAAEQQSAVTEEINRSMVQIRHMVDELVQSGQASETNTRQLLEANGRVSAIMGRFKVS